MRLRGNILKKLHRNIQLCDGTANFWDGAVLLPAKHHKAQQIDDKDHKRLYEDSSDLDCIPDGALEVCAVVAAEGELLAVFHDDAILAVKPRLHLLNPIDLHNR